MPTSPIVVFAISGALSIDVVTSANLIGGMPSDLQHRVDAIWRDAYEKSHGGLFDDDIFVTFRNGRPISPEKRIVGAFVPYRYIFAQHRDRDIAEALRLSVLAVTGVLLTDAGVLLGRRSAAVLQDRQRWGFVPSGGISRDACRADGSVDPTRQLLSEAREELGLAEDRLMVPKAVFLVDDEANRVTDIVLAAGLTKDAALQISDEHDLLTTASWDALDADLGEFRPLDGCTQAVVEFMRTRPEGYKTLDLPFASGNSHYG